MNEFEKFARAHRGISSLKLHDFHSIQSAYVSPTIIEERQLNVATMDVFSRLMMDRIIFLGAPIYDDAANIIQAQLLFLESVDPSKDIQIYINSPGGSVSAGLGIYDTFFGYLLQKATFGGMYFFVFSAFYESMPDSFSEAAEIDGASYFNILITIIIPLSMKMISTVLLIQFIHGWNDYQTAYLYMPSHPTIAYAVWFLTTNNAIGNGSMVIRVAAAMALTTPILLAFIILKDKLMGNLTMGGLKG